MTSSIDQFEIPLPGGSTVTSRFLDDAGTAWWMDRLREQEHCKVIKIGKSRQERQLYGLIIGHGSARVSITAGAHADEPAGPMAACALAWWASEPAQSAFRDQYTLVICPQVNPDGAAANQPWFATVSDMETYLRHVRREGPGDDIEFGYPGDGRLALRSEDAAAADFLRPHAPYLFHASLHSMGFAEGAWFLIGQDWKDRTGTLRHTLAKAAARFGFTLHDIERNGDKGFSRIARGFCTTPTSTAMRAHFLATNDPAMADKFHFSSMEFIRSLGGNPLVMVSEIPNFAIGNGWQPGPRDFYHSELSAPPPSPGTTQYERCRDAIKTRTANGDIAGAVVAARDHGMIPVPFPVHAALQVEMVLQGCSFANDFHGK